MVSLRTSSTDEDLALQARSGDHAAFSDLVREHADRFYRVAYRMLGNAPEAEEIVQNAFLKFWQDPDCFNPKKNAKWTTWFYRVIVNACLDVLKKSGRQSQSVPDDALPTESAGGDAVLAERQRQAALNRAIARLPERQRAALALCYWEELSNQEAADALGLKLKALQSLLVRAKENIKSALSPEWGFADERR